MSAVASAGTAPCPRASLWQVRERYFTVLTIGPLALFMIVFYGLPLASMLLRSVSEPEWTLGNFQAVMDDTIYLRSFWITIKISFFVTIACLVLSLPIAYLLRQMSDRSVKILIMLIMIPLWTSVLIRTFAWMVILGRTGLVNSMLLNLGVIDQPVRLLNTSIAVYVALIHIMLPYMVLPVFNAVKRIDERLLLAAAGLGARPVSVLKSIIIPLTAPGILAGCILVFILCLGMLVTPALVGGSQDMVVSMLIRQQVDLSNWPLASALAAALLAVTLMVLFTVIRLIGAHRVMEGLGR